MSRPARNRLLVFVVMIVAFVVSPRLPTWLTWVLGGAGLPVVGVALWVTAPLRAARTLLMRKQFEQAAMAVLAFEARMALLWQRVLAALAVGFYTSNPKAAARNVMGAVRLDEGKLDEAERMLEKAVKLDDGYAIPFANLAMVAAKRGDRAVAMERREAARKRGYASKTLDAELERSLSEAASRG